MLRKATDSQKHSKPFIPRFCFQVYDTRFVSQYISYCLQLRFLDSLICTRSNLHRPLWPRRFFLSFKICLCIFLYKKNSTVYAHYLHCSISIVDFHRNNWIFNLSANQRLSIFYYFLQVASSWGLMLFLKTNIILDCGHRRYMKQEGIHPSQREILKENNG